MSKGDKQRPWQVKRETYADNWDAVFAHKCSCGWPATLAPNPYAKEIIGDDTPVWMCEECRYQAARDI